ncbi:hypothetical protein CEXT_406901 [Caerostris extrusa]|uniref:Uncharacterized protein n=1 Tax=Caerostris extrusa TaxID=172846 RepID=A0AAV4XUY4_CAEEX|nr:hypothetical protein CEXT_406901 [Caerostris extrusa]
MTFAKHKGTFTELEWNTNALPSQTNKGLFVNIGSKAAPRSVRPPRVRTPTPRRGDCPAHLLSEKHNRNSGPPRACQRQECLMRPTLRVTRRRWAKSGPSSCTSDIVFNEKQGDKTAHERDPF